MKQKKLSTTILVFLPLLLAIIAFFMRKHIIYLAGFLPACPTNSFLRIQCPGCGNTRSAIALLNFDIIGSFKYNITPLVILTCGILLYIELLSWYFGKRIKILTKTPIIIYSIIAVCLLYFLLRNFIH